MAAKQSNKNDDFSAFEIENNRLTNQTYENPAFSNDSLSGNVSHENPKNLELNYNSNRVMPTSDGLDPQYGENRPTTFYGRIQQIQTSGSNFYNKHRTVIIKVIQLVLLVGYFVYFSFAMRHEKLRNEASVRLLWITCTVVFFMICNILYSWFGKNIESGFESSGRFINKRWPSSRISAWKFLTYVFIFLVFAGFVVFVSVDIARKRPKNLISLSGHAIYVILFFMFSYNPSKVRWRPVAWGLGLQFIFALLILRTKWGFEAFNWVGNRVVEFLSYSDEGAKFVFGDKYTDHPFAFKVLPVVVFFSTVVSVLYYLGVMQAVILKLAFVMQKTLGTTAGESVNAAGNIFIGQTEAPLLIRPLIHSMSDSELHAVMTGGFASIAGAVMASYILFGVPANHLITASVMAAPCALAMSKLFYPEVEKTPEEASKKPEMERPPEQNVIEAAASGASTSIKLVANIAANLIAFIALLGFVNATLRWFGIRVGLEPPKYPTLSFQLITSYLLWPFAFVMGVDQKDCRLVAQLIGFKTFINEFVAYQRLGNVVKNSEIFRNHNGSWSFVGPDKIDVQLNGTNITLTGGVMQDERSIVISTYALCGFANISSIGMVIGVLGAMAPEKKSMISRIAVRAMIAGTVASFMNACTAGLLYQG